MSSNRLLSKERLQQACIGRVLWDEPLERHTSIKIGGPAECWYEPIDERALAAALVFASETETPVTVVGGGSNLLAPDDGLKGLVVHLSSSAFKRVELKDGEIHAGGGTPLTSFLQFLVANGFGDCEFLMGVPAQIGGAIMMNAGSADRWIGNYLIRLRALNMKGETLELSREEIPFIYRSSGLRDVIITHGVFRFPEVPQDETRARLGAYSDYRRQTQDLKFPNAGCMFRNPGVAGFSAGRLIDEAGLKGKKIGQAQISNLHANFVVNLGGARQKDVLELLRLAEETVFERSGIRLHREIKIIS